MMRLINLSNNESMELGGMLWANEFALSGYAEEEEYAASGKLIVNRQSKIGGEKMLLTGAKDTSWITLLNLRKLRAWNRDIRLKMRLEMHFSHDTRQFEVTFDNTSGDAINAPKLVDAPALSTDEYYHLASLKLRIDKEITQ